VGGGAAGLKAAAAAAESGAMHDPRKRLALGLVLALLVAPALSGCASSGEPTLASAVAKSGVVAGVVDSLKAADDEAEVQRLHEGEPQSSGEREEARDQHEQVAMEDQQAASGEGYTPTGGE
jgi:hypothetical protein